VKSFTFATGVNVHNTFFITDEKAK
jgi:hypothetical protein